MIWLRTLTVAAVAATASAESLAQQAIANEYGFKLALASETAAYFLSGIKRGAEPESIEAWIWTVTPEPTSGNAPAHDATAQHSVIRCTGKTIEELDTEYYLEGQFVRATEAPMKIPSDVKEGSVMQSVWSVACDMTIRYSVKTVHDIEHVYAEARRTPPKS